MTSILPGIWNLDDHSRLLIDNRHGSSREYDANVKMMRSRGSVGFWKRFLNVRASGTYRYKHSNNSIPSTQQARESSKPREIQPKSTHDLHKSWVKLGNFE
jgi:hypothetical protein